MKAPRASMLAAAFGAACGLWLSCQVPHHYELQDFNCPDFTRPQCCDTCGGQSLVDPFCSGDGWVCPPPSVSSFACPDSSRFCRPPVVNPDAGGCGDGGLPSQETYSFPGCAPATFVCTNDGTLGCALRALQSQSDQCQASAECVEASFSGGCTGWGSCPPFSVTAASRAAFLNAARAEVSRYCSCPNCSWSSQCPVAPDAGAPRCLYGRCTWVSGSVAYPCAERTSGACFPACATDEACFTQVRCPGGASTDGGCLPAPVDAGLALGDELCHRRCLADGGCPAGQACFQVAFYGCRPGDGGAPPTTAICCAEDAGCR